jgi:hypothetical protein
VWVGRACKWERVEEKAGGGEAGAQRVRAAAPRAMRAVVGAGRPGRRGRAAAIAPRRAGTPPPPALSSRPFTSAKTINRARNPSPPKNRSDVTVLVLDRPRHAGLIAQIRAAGARIRMISDGDVGGAIETAKPGAPVDVLMGG